MTLNHVDAIVTQALKKSGYTSERRESVSTNSIYYKIYSSSGCDLMFRVADHSTKSDVITLRVDKKLTEQSIKNFVSNRVADLGHRALKKFFGE